MVNCRSLRSEHFPDRELCEWYVQTTGKPPQTLDTGETYVDLTDFYSPLIQKNKPDGKISPRELYSAVTGLLEREWQPLFAHQSLLFQKRPQPIAEELYDRFDFLPPWLPKPLAKMNAAEKKLFRNFLVAIQYRGATEAIHRYLRYVGADAIVEDDFFGILTEGASGCVGMTNLDYFAEKIVKGGLVEFVEFYRGRYGDQLAHVGVLLNQQPYDPSAKKKIDGEYGWFVNDPMDQWATSLMNTGDSKMKLGRIDATQYVKNYASRAFDFAPDYFRVQFYLGVAFYTVGVSQKVKKAGIDLLKMVKLLYPDFQELSEWKDLLTP